MPAAFTLYAESGDTPDFLYNLADGVRNMHDSVSRVANDTAGIMAQVVTQDTGELARQMAVLGETSGPGMTTATIGSTAQNRSGREYAYFEHRRHAGNSFFDQGYNYANDALWEMVVAELNKAG